MVGEILNALTEARSLVSDACTIRLPCGLVECMKDQDAWIRDVLHRAPLECVGLGIEIVPHTDKGSQNPVATVLFRNHLTDLQRRMATAVVNEIAQADSVGITAMCMSPAAHHGTLLLTYMCTNNLEDVATVLRRHPGLPQNARDTLCSWDGYLYWEPRFAHDKEGANRIYSRPGHSDFMYHHPMSDSSRATPVQIRQEGALLLPIVRPGVYPLGEEKLELMVQNAVLGQEVFLEWGSDEKTARMLVAKLKAAGVKRPVFYRDACGWDVAYGGNKAEAFARGIQGYMDDAVVYAVATQGVSFLSLDIPAAVPWGLVKMVFDNSVARFVRVVEERRTVRLVVTSGVFHVVCLRNAEYRDALKEVVAHLDVEHVPEEVMRYVLD